LIIKKDMTYNNISEDYATGDNFPVIPSEGLEATVTTGNNSKLHSFAKRMVGKSKEEIRNAGKKAGFTLVELIASICIISYIASITLPALSGAREKSRRTICANNQRQIVLAMNMYAQDNDGFLPIEYKGLGNLLSDSNGEKQKLGRLIPDYVKIIDSFYCPTQERFSKNNLDSGAQNFCVNIISKSCSGSYTTSYGPSTGFIKVFNPKRPLVLDINLKYDQTNPPIRSHKGNGVNVAYIDGNVKWFSGKYNLGVVGILDSDTQFDLK
jgi:prepilin-type N-terminal cleavage/methylation domain-containing protein/prepilin-type processing-associated H-X9-DG protein